MDSSRDSSNTKLELAFSKQGSSTAGHPCLETDSAQKKRAESLQNPEQYIEAMAPFFKGDERYNEVLQNNEHPRGAEQLSTHPSAARLQFGGQSLPTELMEHQLLRKTVEASDIEIKRMKALLVRAAEEVKNNRSKIKEQSEEIQRLEEQNHEIVLENETLRVAAKNNVKNESNNCAAPDQNGVTGDSLESLTPPAEGVHSIIRGSSTGATPAGFEGGALYSAMQALKRQNRELKKENEVAMESVSLLKEENARLQQTLEALKVKQRSTARDVQQRHSLQNVLHSRVRSNSLGNLDSGSDSDDTKPKGYAAMYKQQPSCGILPPGRGLASPQPDINPRLLHSGPSRSHSKALKNQKGSRNRSKSVKKYDIVGESPSASLPRASEITQAAPKTTFTPRSDTEEMYTEAYKYLVDTYGPSHFINQFLNIGATRDSTGGATTPRILKRLQRSCEPLATVEQTDTVLKELIKGLTYALKLRGCQIRMRRVSSCVYEVEKPSCSEVAKRILSPLSANSKESKEEQQELIGLMSLYGYNVMKANEKKRLKITVIGGKASLRMGGVAVELIDYLDSHGFIKPSLKNDNQKANLKAPKNE